MIPVLWQGGPVEIYTHDLFSVAGVAVGLVLAYRSLRAAGLLEDRVVLASLAVVVGAVVGARLITAWEHPDYYPTAIAAGAPFSWLVEHSGKSLLGALGGGYATGWVAKRLLRYEGSTADHYALAIAVGTAIGRVGCFLSELPLGTPSDLPWAISVSPEAAAAFGRCPSCAVPMHPSMLYEVVFNLAAAIAIVRWRAHVPVRGDLLRLYLLAAFAFRFLVEFVRGNEVQAFGLTGPQIVLIPMTALLAGHFLRQARRGAWRVPAAPPAPGAPRHAPAVLPPPLTGEPSPSWRAT